MNKLLNSRFGLLVHCCLSFVMLYALMNADTKKVKDSIKRTDSGKQISSFVESKLKHKK